MAIAIVHREERQAGDDRLHGRFAGAVHKRLQVACVGRPDAHARKPRTDDLAQHRLAFDYDQIIRSDASLADSLVMLPVPPPNSTTMPGARTSMHAAMAVSKPSVNQS